MGKTMSEMERLVDEFAQQYMFQPPHHQYVNAVGVSTIKCKTAQFKISFTLKSGESLDDYCLGVYLRQTPPSNLFPTEYKDVRVFYTVGGEIHPL